jgi:hypothetical protein
LGCYKVPEKREKCEKKGKIEASKPKGPRLNDGPEFATRRRREES